MLRWKAYLRSCFVSPELRRLTIGPSGKGDSSDRRADREAEVVCDDECTGWTLTQGGKSVVGVSTWGFPEV